MYCKNQGRKLIEAMDLWGIVEPEFKFDERDGNITNGNQFKTHDVASGRSLTRHLFELSQYLDLEFLMSQNWKQTICTYKDIHFVNFQYEFLNLLNRKKYS
jgi:hypothetical protein